MLVKEIKVGYGKIQVIFGISFEIYRDEIVTIIGSNGSGKSTVARTISGLLHPIEGEIIFNGCKISGLKPHEVASKGIAHVPEGRKLFSSMTVRDNLEIGAYLQKDSKERIETINYVFNLFPRLKERQKQKAGTLSGGEQQMLAIGRGLNG
jgi:branched-chain amino acid transport system ATP-binding protein